MINETYFLPQHVFVCSTTRYVVILDLIADKYICVQRRVLDGLAPCLSGWIPLPGKVAESSTSHTDGANVIETLLAEGILTKGRADAKPVAPAPIAVANAALAPVSKQARSVILFRYLRSFVMACVSADRALRKQPLASVVARTAARRLQYDRGTQSFDMEATSKLVAAFNGLRWWYPRTYVCMFDSLAFA